MTLADLLHMHQGMNEGKGSRFVEIFISEKMKKISESEENGMEPKKLGFGLMRLPTLDPQNAASVDIEQLKQMVDLL